MARGGDGWDDAKCFACAKIVSPGRTWRDADPDAVELALSPPGWCSWCGRESRHRVTRVVGTRGNAYLSHCSSCARATHKCERCCDGFAKIGDGRCAKCAGHAEDWNAGEEAFIAATRVTAWCSWCGERCAHTKRGNNVGNGSNVGGGDASAYECLVCGGGTKPCEECGPERGVMRKRSRPGGGGSCIRCRIMDDAPPKKINIGGYVSIPTIGAITSQFKRAWLSRRQKSVTAEEGHVDSPNASAEDVERKWQTRVARREAADEQAAYVFEVLERDSEYKDKAYRAGLIRPFFLLATLPPRERARLGMRLGVALCRSSSYFDAHAEAWKLLRDPTCGLQTKGGSVSKVVEKVTGAGRGANWLDIMHTALTLGAETGKCPAMDPRELSALPKFRSSGHALFALRVSAHPALMDFELAVLRLVTTAQRGRLAPGLRTIIDGVVKHPRMDALRSRFRKAYGARCDEVARHAVVVTFASSPWASTTAASTPSNAEVIAEGIFNMLLDGAPMTRGDLRASEMNDTDADVNISRGAPSLLGSLAASTSIGFAAFTAAQFAPRKFALLTPRDVLDLTAGVRTPTLAASGVFEPVAVMLVHNVLLIARSVYIDDYLPSEAKRLSREATAAMRSPSVAATPQPLGESSASPETDRAANSPWSPKYAHLEDVGADERLGELDDAEESAAMLARYINSLDTSDLLGLDESIESDDGSARFDE